jgi:hypothetical protein
MFGGMIISLAARLDGVIRLSKVAKVCMGIGYYM